ncbi:hypothetical protein [Mycobacteroides chelonae]|uniref:Uncharacterized protein n=1 Tax=Mycobacteroides chelonae TaxID=1774 RepID=A0A1S1LTD9_MYCCH|nr:hypothetical protein [Mycobacteroides chelonae]OHU76044.1 hypothetical protein BKG84_24420 [Mycobacteroides chelonae]
MRTSDLHTETVDWLAVDHVTEGGAGLHLLEPERAEAARRMHRQGLTAPEMAARLGVTPKALRGILVRAGLSAPIITAPQRVAA